MKTYEYLDIFRKERVEPQAEKACYYCDVCILKHIKFILLKIKQNVTKKNILFVQFLYLLNKKNLTLILTMTNFMFISGMVAKLSPTDYVGFTFS
jgi:hypothetical protein